jgi:spermidine/putrescine transport system ATP-binding protein
MSLLTLDSVRKEFGDVVAVADASFRVDDGEFVSILGPSGSGKSTILRTIAGFEEPTAGAVRMRGTDLVGVPPFERDVNMVFQSLALFPHMTVAENIAYGLRNRGVDATERADRIERMLEMVRLSGYGDRDPTDLSGGEQQRVALARAVVTEPGIVLFDEPLASLDRKLRQHMQVELQRIQAETGITFLYVTHDQEVAMAVSDRLILLDDGEIEQIGPAEELYERPDSRFVADFIGDTNSIPVTVTDATDGRLDVRAASTTVEWALDAAAVGRDATPNTGDELVLCVRPHALAIGPPDAGGPLSVRGLVKNRVYGGNTVDYAVDSALGGLTVTTDDGGFDVGDEVAVSWSIADAHVFPADGAAAEGSPDRDPVAPIPDPEGPA